MSPIRVFYEYQRKLKPLLVSLLAIVHSDHCTLFPNYWVEHRPTELRSPLLIANEHPFGNCES